MYKKVCLYMSLNKKIKKQNYMHNKNKQKKGKKKKQNSQCENNII